VVEQATLLAHCTQKVGRKTACPAQ